MYRQRYAYWQSFAVISHRKVPCGTAPGVSTSTRIIAAFFISIRSAGLLRR